MKKAIYLAIQYMKNQRGRTFSLIIGISLAVMLVFSLNVIPETESKIEIEKAYKTYADYHVEYNNLDYDTVNNIKKEKGTRDMFTIFNLGNIVDKNGITMSLNSYSEEFLKEYGYDLIKGSMPKKENEIVLESKTVEVMGLDNKLNQEINFKIEKSYKDENGENQIFSKDYKFKLVGIVSKPKMYYEDYKYHNLKAFTYYQKESDNFIPTDLVSYGGVLSFNTKAPSMNKIYQISGKYGLSEMNFTGNAGLIQTLNYYDINGTTTFEVKNKVLPMFTSVLVIYNIFNMILADMTKQIGMLKAIGATKKHIRAIILIQSLVVLIIGTSIGILLGSITSYIGLAIIYKELISLYISKNSLIEPIIMASVTVLIASIVPIYKCGKISPIEAIRKIDKSNLKQKDRFYYKYIRIVFGLTGEMAYKNVWRNKIRTILSIVAISLGGILYIDNMAIYNQDSGHEKTSSLLMSMGDIDINLRHNNYNVDSSIAGYTSEDINKVSNIKNIKSIESSTSINGFLKSNITYFTSNYTQQNLMLENQENVESRLWMQGYDNRDLKSFKKYIEKGSTYIANNNDTYPSVLVYNQFYSEGNNEKQILKDLKLGDLIVTKIPIIKDGNKVYEEVTVKVAGILNRSWGRERDGGTKSDLQVIMSQDDLWKITGRDTYNKVSMRIEKGTDQQVHKDLEQIVKNEPFGEIESKYIYNQMFEKQEIENKRVILLTVSLILIISSLNILCTIKTNLLIRINEFATLRAVGMSMKILKNMIMKEAILYGILGSIISSVGGTYKHYKYVSMVNSISESGFGSFNTMGFSIPIVPIVQYSLVCILICVVSVLLVRKKVEKLSIVEGLRIND